MQENAGAEQQQGRQEQRANRKLMQMIDTSLAPMAAAWTTRNKAASAVSRPGQQPAVEGLHEEQEDLMQDKAPEQLCHSAWKRSLESKCKLLMLKARAFNWKWSFWHQQKPGHLKGLQNSESIVVAAT